MLFSGLTASSNSGITKLLRYIKSFLINVHQDVNKTYINNVIINGHPYQDKANV